MVNTPGQLPTGYIQDSSTYHFCGGTLYNDADTGTIWVENQVSLGSSETILGKENFEQWLWEKVCVEISHMNSDNSFFASGQLRLDCDNKNQEQYFSGVGA